MEVQGRSTKWNRCTGISQERATRDHRKCMEDHLIQKVPRVAISVLAGTSNPRLTWRDYDETACPNYYHGEQSMSVPLS